jgi:hypothetical protein
MLSEMREGGLGKCYPRRWLYSRPAKTRSMSIGRLPSSSLDQRMDALGRANEVRALRAQLKRDLKADRVSNGALLLNQPPYLKTAKVFDMLLALPKVGRVKATKILHSCRVSPARHSAA